MICSSMSGPLRSPTRELPKRRRVGVKRQQPAVYLTSTWNTVSLVPLDHHLEDCLSFAELVTEAEGVYMRFAVYLRKEREETEP